MSRNKREIKENIEEGLVREMQAAKLVYSAKRTGATVKRTVITVLIACLHTPIPIAG